MPSPFAHFLFGVTTHVATAPAADLGWRRRTAITAAAAVAPDLDLVLKQFGLAVHQGASHGIGGMDCTIYEDRSRPHYFMEVFRFKDEAEFTAFDDKFHKDRKIAAIYALLDDIVEAEKSDFKIFERRL